MSCHAPFIRLRLVTASTEVWMRNSFTKRNGIWDDHFRLAIAFYHYAKVNSGREQKWNVFSHRNEFENYNIVSHSHWPTNGKYTWITVYNLCTNWFCSSKLVGQVLGLFYQFNSCAKSNVVRACCRYGIERWKVSFRMSNIATHQHFISFRTYRVPKPILTFPMTI